MPIKALGFDVDGTLYPSISLDLRAAPLVLRHLRFFTVFSGVRRELRALAKGEDYRLSPPPDGIAFRRLQASLTARRLGTTEKAAAALVDSLIYHEIAELFSGLSPYPGLASALDGLAGAGIRLAALSDLPPERKLELLGLESRFEAALCSEDSGFLKPAAAPFGMLCSALGLEPSEILYVGNSATYDLAGAKAAGMEAAIVSRMPVPGAAVSFFDWGKLAAFVLSKG